MPKPSVFREVSRTVYFNSIPAELKRLGLTQAKTAELLGISLSGLSHRLKADSPSLHWSIYGLSSYFSEEDNLGERDL